MPKVKISNSRGIEQTTGGGVLLEELTMRRDGEAKLGHTGFILGKNSPADAEADPYTQGTTQLWPLGTKMIYGDRVFVYALMGGTVTAGKLVAQARKLPCQRVRIHHGPCWKMATNGNKQE